MTIDSNEDSLIFPDGDTLELRNVNDITYKLPEYNESACELGLRISWGDAKYWQNVKNAEGVINSLPEPYKEIQYEDNIKVIGDTMTGDTTIIKTVSDRLNKAKLLGIV